MSSPITPASEPQIVYPDCDGHPMSDNTLQFKWIVTIKGGLEALFRNDSSVFVAGDLLLYPVDGNPKIRTAPDAMVVFGRPKGYRGSYKQWEFEEREAERRRAQAADQRAERLAARLRELGGNLNGSPA